MTRKKIPQRPNKPRQVTSNSTKPLGPVMAGPAADRFWALIRRVEAQSQGEVAKASAAFRSELEALDDAALLEAHECFHGAMARAFDGLVWSAAILMHGECAEERFAAYRAGLIALGRHRYEQSLRDPDSLAEVPDVQNRTRFEGFEHVPGAVVEARGLSSRLVEHGAAPKKPTRELIDEDLLQIRFPAIAEKFA